MAERICLAQFNHGSDAALQLAALNKLDHWDRADFDSGYGDERFAFTLVIARHGHVIRRVTGEPIIWKWIFWADGRQVAYETGAFHFSDTCYLLRLSDGRKLDSYDCYHEVPLAKPDWVKALDAAE